MSRRVSEAVEGETRWSFIILLFRDLSESNILALGGFQNCKRVDVNSDLIEGRCYWNVHYSRTYQKIYHHRSTADQITFNWGINSQHSRHACQSQINDQANTKLITDVHLLAEELKSQAHKESLFIFHPALYLNWREKRIYLSSHSQVTIQIRMCWLICQ